MVDTSEDFDKTQKEDEIENIGLGCALEHFSEVTEILSMIDNLKNVYNAQLSVVEKAYERYLYILDQYHEQPHLLDSHIDQLLERLINIVRNIESPTELKHEAFKYMYVIIKVRGYKIVVRHLPHEITDFEPVLQCLEEQDPNSTDTWTTRYVLLLWLSIIVKIPFHMSRFDDTENMSNRTIMFRLFEICKTYAVVGDKCRDAAAYLASQFLTRVDVKEEYMAGFFDWSCDIVNAKDSTSFMKQGALSTVAMIIKHGKREDLLPHADKILRWIINTDYKDCPGTHIPKLGFKIVQRIGLVYLRPHLAPWRYQRGNRILKANLSGGDAHKQETAKVSVKIEDEEEIDVPDEIEDVIDELMQGLRSSDGVVRWSAAKGIGRVTGRLPKDMADDVLGSILELFNPREGDGAWHGGCLTLAELGRRGLLLPQRLPEVVPVVIKALMYDELRGYASVGSHIRDSACYVCWAFARAYEVEDLKPYVEDIACALIIVAVFDREVNCRRAASAAFQENVGRQGTFPHGIDILTVADFFAVGIRTNAYLNISVYIAQFEEYTNALIDHLIDKKVDHWDVTIRELTAKALHNLTPKAPDYLAGIVLDKLFEKTINIDLNARHGAILAIGEILHALSLTALERNCPILNILKENTIQQVRDLIPNFRQRLLFRGLGGELMKQACSSFIKKCSLAHMPYHNTPVLDDWLLLLNECLSYEVPSIRTAAIDALPAYFNEYYRDTKQSRNRDVIVQQYIDQLKENNKIVRSGHLLALGSLPLFMIEEKVDYLIEAIIKSTEITETTLKWAESRRDALKALTQISTTVGSERDLNPQIIKNMYETFLNGFTEYTQDNRGDIGAWVREAAMTGIQSLTILLANFNPIVLQRDLVSKVMASVAQQAVEKIDRTRAIAGKVFSSIIHNDPIVPNIPYHNEIQLIFPSSDCEMLNWNSEAITFPKFVRLLPYEDYTYNLMLGLIVSIGGLTETLVKTSSASFFAYLNTLKEDKNEQEISRICDVILDIFTKYQKVDRITVSIFKFFEKLMSSGCIQCVIDDSNSKFIPQMLKLIQLEISGCRDIYKLIDGIGALCPFLQVPRNACSTALVQLSILLCHRHTYVRKATSTRLYEALLVYGENSTIPEENLDEIMTLVSETNWEKPVDEIKPIRNSLCELMGVRIPVLKKKN